MKTTLEQLQKDMIPMMLLDPEIRESIVRQHHDAVQTNQAPRDFSSITRWENFLYLRAGTYEPMPPAIYADLTDKPLEFGTESGYKNSGHARWRLESKTLPRGQRLRTYQKAGVDKDPRRGWVQFDGPVSFPTLSRKGYWPEWEVIMSLTPHECISLRAGARMAKGHVVITGLGLGYLLWLVTQRPQVKHVTLIEVDHGVLDNIMPRLRPHLRIEPLIINDDCRRVLNGMTGDVLLLDHFDGFGYNFMEVEYEWTKGFKKTWIWG